MRLKSKFALKILMLYDILLVYQCNKNMEVFIMKIKDRTKDVMELLEEETTRSNKELLIAAAVCTFVGLVIGFFAGKIVTNKNTVKKFNKCFTYDFGDEAEENTEE